MKIFTLQPFLFKLSIVCESNGCGWDCKASIIWWWPKICLESHVADKKASFEPCRSCDPKATKAFEIFTCCSPSTTLWIFDDISCLQSIDFCSNTHHVQMHSPCALKQKPWNGQGLGFCQDFRNPVPRWIASKGHANTLNCQTMAYFATTCTCWQKA